jgi:ABC-2 type transport system permease protein
VTAPRSYLAIARASFLAMLAYRVRFYMGIVNYVIYVAVYSFLWRAVFAHQEAGSVDGYALGEMLTYVAVGWMARSLYFNTVDHDLAESVLEGRVASDLLRPLSFLGRHVFHALGETLFRALFFAPPVALAVALLFPVAGPASPRALAFSLASVALSIFVLAGVNFLVGLLAFRLRSIQGVLRAKGYALDFLSGLLMPVPLFPQWLQSVSVFLPFQQIAYAPLRLYLWKVKDSEALVVLAVQGAWAIGTLLAGALAARLAMRALVVHGG